MPPPEGLRERKRQRTRAAITRAALRLFAERGYDAVTMTEIAAAAEISRATLFTYFPSKRSLIVDTETDDDPARIVAERAGGRTPIDALRRFYLDLAAAPIDADAGELMARVAVIAEAPGLAAGLHHHAEEQRRALAATLADGAEPDLLADLLAAEICAAIATVKARFFRALADGTPMADAHDRLAAEIALAFDLIEDGSRRHTTT
ncbi:MAG TPA: helix-turn-helix domain-containing protein [Stackebrandtia sp.]|jgi:AcrR family transcriptional regulator|uniref:TetR/AcrR family transcriptional regulator n=1 Tax=Stackebrandtia sp. TaxID=2023065 RepID=UPI002D401DE7|nr:helix-turn-helix domain-containing protein [Stackebrandtia sp.]HZE37944.1 helix-turn-helix domain-containing protein [Stackebrandtia sp.]